MAKSLFVFDAEAGKLSAGDGPRSAAAEVGRRRLPRAGRAAPDRAGADARVQLGARRRVAVEEVDARPRAPVARGQAADQPALAAAVAEGAGRARKRADDADRSSPARAASCPKRWSTSSRPRPSRPASRRSARRCRSRRWRRSRWSTDFEDDDEMREIFLEEAREVVADGARPRCAELQRRPTTSS